MAHEFSQAIEGWHDFYLMTGTAAATLVGLLFVAVSVNLNLLRGAAAQHRREWARHTFLNFIFVLLVSLIFLMPAQSELGLALPLLIIAAVAFFGVARLYREATRLATSGDEARVRQRMMREAIYSAGSYLILVIVALFLLRSEPQQLYWLAAAVLMLLIEAAGAAWRLLVVLVNFAQPDSEETG